MKQQENLESVKRKTNKAAPSKYIRRFVMPVKRNKITNTVAKSTNCETASEVHYERIPFIWSCRRI